MLGPGASFWYCTEGTDAAAGAQIVTAAFWYISCITWLLLSCAIVWPIMCTFDVWRQGSTASNKGRSGRAIRWKLDFFPIAPSGLDLSFATKQTRCGRACVWTTWAEFQAISFERVHLPQHMWSKSGEISKATNSPAAQSAAEIPDDSKISKHSKAAVSLQQAADMTWKQQLFSPDLHLKYPKVYGTAFSLMHCSHHNPSQPWNNLGIIQQWIFHPIKSSPNHINKDVPLFPLTSIMQTQSKSLTALQWKFWLLNEISFYVFYPC